MKKLICENFCSFYKPGSESRTKCGSFEFLKRNLTRREIKSAIENTPRRHDLSFDPQIRSLVCENNCEFYNTDDCDFRLGNDSPPCGGYTIVENLLKGVKPFLTV